MASLLSGLPEVVPVTTVNRQCSSGLQAIANVAASIKAGFYDIAIAGGVESMSTNSMDRWDGGINQEALQHPSAKGCYLPMGQVCVQTSGAVVWNGVLLTPQFSDL